MNELDRHGVKAVAMPPWGEDEFARLVGEMVADEAPRLFALVEEHGERKDARIAAFGMAFGDRAVVGSGEFHLTSRDPESARARLELGARPRGVRVRLVWVDRAAAPDR